MTKLAEISNNSFERKNATFLVEGGKRYYGTSYIFSGGYVSRPQPPKIYGQDGYSAGLAINRPQPRLLLSGGDPEQIVQKSCASVANRCGAPTGAGGHDPPLFEAKGDGGHNLEIIL